MLRRTLRILWVPNYSRGQQQDRGGAGGRRPEGARRSGGRSQSRPAATRQQHQRPQSRQQRPPATASVAPTATSSSLPFVTILDGPGSTVSKTRRSLATILSTAAELATAWRRAGENPFVSAVCTPDASPPGVGGEGYRRFTALRDVLGPLSQVLPPPPAHMQQPAAASPGTGSLEKLRVVPDPLSGGAAPAVPQPLPLSRTTSFSLEELTAFLELYQLAASQDGELLLRLLGEVNRFFVGNMAAAASKRAEVRTATLPLPELLLTLSTVGISEERVLQTIAQRPQRDSATPAGLLYTYLPFYSVSQLVSLTVALHRFGLHQDNAFKQTMDALLHRHIFSARSDAYHYSKQMEKLAKQCAQRSQPDKDGSNNSSPSSKSAAGDRAAGHSPLHHDLSAHEPFTAEELRGVFADERAGDAAGPHLFDGLPPLPASLRCSPSLTAEALTAVSLSVFRRPEAVALLSHLLLSVSIAEVAEVVSSPTRTAAEKRTALTAISHKLLRGVQLCEEMNDPQPLLATGFAFSIDVGKAGVIGDGGEDTEFPSERRAYYDNVTADLIKAKHTL